MSFAYQVRGAATLIALLLLTLTMALLMAVAHERILFEQHASARQLKAAVVLEAAQAGLAWTLSQLNRTYAVGPQCQALNTSESFAARYAAQTPTGLGCTQSNDTQWLCACPSGPSAAASSAPADAIESPAFRVQIQPGSRSPLLDITSQGCLAPPELSCLPGAIQAQVQLTAGRIPALAWVPQASLTVHGQAHLAQAPWVFNAEPAESTPKVTIHAGQGIELAATNPQPISHRDHDAPLQALTPAAMFTHFFGMDAPTWKNQITVQSIICASTCDQAWLDLQASHPAQTMVWFEGGLHLRQPLTLGSPTHPVVLVVDGPVEFESPVVIHGVLYSTALAWKDAAPGSHIHGAVIIANHLQALGETHLHYQLNHLQYLHQQAGTYVPVNSSWRNF